MSDIPNEQIQMYPIRLGVIDPKPESASSFYRSWGVFPELKKISGNLLDPVALPNLSWNTLEGCDAVFIRSPVGQHSIPMVEHIKGMGYPVWMDFDDAVDVMPTTLPLYMRLGDQSKIMQTLWEKADILTTSSSVLHSRWSLMGYATKSFHLPNTISVNTIVRWASIVPPRKENTVKKLWWRGGQSHHENGVFYINSLEGVDNNCKVVFQGYDFFNPPFAVVPDEVHSTRTPIKNPFTNYEYIPWESIPTCFTRAMSINPDVAIVMHTPTMFNNCKSNSAWLEAVIAGAVSVVPNTPEWVDLPHVFLYTPGDTKGFRKAVDEALAISANDQTLRLRESMDYILQNFNSVIVNQKRLQISMNLASRFSGG